MTEIAQVLERLKALKPLMEGKLDAQSLMQMQMYGFENALKDAEYLDEHLPSGDPRREDLTRLLQVLRKTLKR